MVRIFSSSAFSQSLARRRSKAIFRLASWKRSLWAVTTIPVGLWVSLTAVETFWTFCPPWELALKNWISTSLGLSLTSLSFISGKVTTVAVEVWILPLLSVDGTLWTRWTPASFFNPSQAPKPEIKRVLSSKKLTFQPRRAAYLRYILVRSLAQILASSPPVAPRTSK